MVERVNAIVLTGGSAHADSMRRRASFVISRNESRLRDRRNGGPDRPRRRPDGSRVRRQLDDQADGRLRIPAATAASSEPVAEGNVGAGAGATVGKLLGGNERAMKAGIGSASISLSSGLVVAAIAAVNAVGDVIDPTTGMVVAGIRTDDGKRLADARVLLRSPLPSRTAPRPGGNTTLAVVATNARLTKPKSTA